MADAMGAWQDHAEYAAETDLAKPAEITAFRCFLESLAPSAAQAGASGKTVVIGLAPCAPQLNFGETAQSTDQSATQSQ